MHESTIAFLDAMANRNATSSAYARDAEQELLRLVGDGLKECFEFQLAFDEVELLESDRVVLSTLGEYESKIGAFMRVGHEFREKLQELARIRREIDDLETRAGQPMRERAARDAVKA